MGENFVSPWETNMSWGDILVLLDLSIVKSLQEDDIFDKVSIPVCDKPIYSVKVYKPERV